MSAWNRIMRAAGWRRPQVQRSPRRQLRRGLAAAASSRLTADWAADNSSANNLLAGGLDVVRGRARDLAFNNDYARRFLNLVVRNVVGPTGPVIRPDVRTPRGKPDTQANQRIRDGWRAWCERGTCEMSGRLGWVELCGLTMRSVARDGEVLAQHVRGANNGHGYALHLLEADHLDTQHNDPGRNLSMGVQADRWGRPTVYHLLEQHPGDGWALAGQQARQLRADQLLHLFLAERIGQRRGIPWMISAAARLNMLGRYEEAEVIASRVAASKMGFFSEDPDEFGGYGDEDLAGEGEVYEDGETEDDQAGSGADYEIPMSAEPGTFDRLPPGVSLSTWDPQHPAGNFDAFMRRALQGAAAGLDLWYSGFANDRKGESYSSGRLGLMDEREMWMGIQGWWCDAFVRPVYQQWLGWAVTTGAVNLPPEQLERFRRVQIRGRRWKWMDPHKDQQGHEKALGNQLTSRTRLAEEQGEEWAEIAEELLAEQQTLAPLQPAPAAATDEGSET